MELDKEVEDVLTQIKREKGRGKHFVKIKVYQSTTNKKVGHPTDVYIKTGMYENGSGEKALLDLGYSIAYEKQKRVCTVTTKTGVVPNGNILNTTVMVVRW